MNDKNETRFPALVRNLIKLSAHFPPWELVMDSPEHWQKELSENGLSQYRPLARMINDDIVAVIDEKNSLRVYLFVFPLSKTTANIPFKSLSLDEWFRLALDDCYEYILNY